MKLIHKPLLATVIQINHNKAKQHYKGIDGTTTYCRPTPNRSGFIATVAETIVSLSQVIGSNLTARPLLNVHNLL